MKKLIALVVAAALAFQPLAALAWGNIFTQNSAGGGGGGASTFDQLGSGSNTTATMTVGSGGTLTFSGSGVVNANQINGQTAINVSGTPATGDIFVQSSTPGTAGLLSDVAAGALLCSAGVVVLPSYCNNVAYLNFTGSTVPANGIYLPAANTLGFAANTTLFYRMDPTGHMISTGTAPTMGACGTSPSIVGTDEAMVVTVGSGGSATTCAVTWATAATTNAPVCSVINDTDRVAYSTVETTTTITITATAAFTAGSKFKIRCKRWL